jgi:hypothetical protein
MPADFSLSEKIANALIPEWQEFNIFLQGFVKAALLKLLSYGDSVTCVHNCNCSAIFSHSPARSLVLMYSCQATKQR